MTVDPVDQTVTTQEPSSVAGRNTVSTESRSVSTTGPGGSEMIRRIVMLIFGLIQLVIGLRVALLLLGAQQANGIVSWILNLSQLFVAPFEGILRTNGLASNGNFFDITAIVALVGWTILELIVIWAVGIFRRQQA
jgi:YGGT family